MIISPEETKRTSQSDGVCRFISDNEHDWENLPVHSASLNAQWFYSCKEKTNKNLLVSIFKESAILHKLEKKNGCEKTIPIFAGAYTWLYGHLWSLIITLHYTAGYCSIFLEFWRLFLNLFFSSALFTNNLPSAYLQLFGQK